MTKTPSTAVAMSGEPRRGSRYPAPHNAPCIGRAKYVLGDQFGLDQFGVNLAVIEPGSWSAQRHWHEQEDEFVYVLDLEVGSRKEGEIAHYSDIDMKALPDGGKYKFVKKDGSSF